MSYLEAGTCRWMWMRLMCGFPFPRNHHQYHIQFLHITPVRKIAVFSSKTFIWSIYYNFPSDLELVCREDQGVDWHFQKMDVHFQFAQAEYSKQILCHSLLPLKMTDKMLQFHHGNNAWQTAVAMCGSRWQYRWLAAMIVGSRRPDRWGEMFDKRMLILMILGWGHNESKFIFF